MKIFTKILVSLEEIKETQKIHSSILQSLMRQSSQGTMQIDMADVLSLPLKNEDDVNVAEELLQDHIAKQRLVSLLLIDCNMFIRMKCFLTSLYIQ